MRPVATIAVLLSLAVAGCGVTASKGTTFSGTKGEIASQVSSLSSDASHNSDSKICTTLLSTRLVRSLGGPRKCSNVIGDAVDDADSGTIDVKGITLGPNNTAVAHVKTSGGGAQNITANMRFVKQGGTWRIDSFG